MSAGPKVTVLGALHLDVLVETPRLPRRDETLMGGSVRYVQGGKGGNQAVAAARMGVPTAMLGQVGDDAFGPMLVAALRAAGVDTAGIRTLPDAATGMSAALLEPDGSYAAVVVSGANRSPGAPPDLPADTTLLCLQNEIPDEANLAAAKRAQALGARVILNAAPARPLPEALAARLDVLIVNRVEVSDMTGAADPADALAALAARLPAETAILVTLGADGLIARLGSDAPRHLPAPRIDQVSSHGAGDRFAGTLAGCLAGGEDWDEALATAQAAAALHAAGTAAERDRIDRAAVAAFRAAQAAIR